MTRFLFIGVLVVTGIVSAKEPGGCAPFLGSCCIGPRVGLEMNEGIPVSDYEVCNMFCPYLFGYQALHENGVKGCMYSFCVGPRIGMQLGERRPRKIEQNLLYLGIGANVVSHLMIPGASDPDIGPLVPVVAALPLIGRVFIAVEAFKGKTMTEIEEEEGLARQ